MDRARLVGINNEIALHAKRKELTPAMELFQNAVNEGIANSHTYAAIINANIRCGSVSGAESVLKDMAANGRRKDVIICTTMMKGYCGEGQINKALNLLEQMGNSKPKIVPNIRTVNTILRGCVQIGDIDNAEIVLNKALKEYQLTLDVSSWEYLIVLYSHGLRLDKALPIVGRLKDDPNMASGIAGMHLNIARAAALLGEWKTCRKSLLAASNVLQNGTVVSTEAKQEETENTETSTKKSVVGGKRAWKSGPGADNQDGDVDTRRLQSLEVFREHSKEEMLHEIKIIEDFVTRMQQEKESSLKYLFPYYLRMFSFSSMDHETNNHESNNSANSNSISNDSSSKNARDILLEEILHDVDNKFGLGPFVKKITNKSLSSLLGTSVVEESIPSPPSNKKNKKGNKDVVTAVPLPVDTPDAVFAKEQIKRIQESLSLRILTSGKLDFKQIFEDNEDNGIEKPLLKMEICSGAGEWAVAQAKEDVANRWITLELRHDRVYQTLTKSLFAGAKNMCILGGDAMKILPERISNDVIDYLFVNHPEPPQQTGGLESQGKHLMTNEFFLETNRILSPNGTFTIVTDNLWYGKFLMRQLSGLITSTVATSTKTKNRFLLRSVTLTDKSESDEWNVQDSVAEGKVYLFVGKPGPSAGHVVDASSYFDRLWKREKLSERYFIILKKKLAADTINENIPKPNNVKQHADTKKGGNSNSGGSGKIFQHNKKKDGKQHQKPFKDFKKDKPFRHNK